MVESNHLITPYESAPWPFWQPDIWCWIRDSHPYSFRNKALNFARLLFRQSNNKFTYTKSCPQICWVTPWVWGHWNGRDEWIRTTTGQDLNLLSLPLDYIPIDKLVLGTGLEPVSLAASAFEADAFAWFRQPSILNHYGPDGWIWTTNQGGLSSHALPLAYIGILKLVCEVGLEPTRLSAPPPQGGETANSSTRTFVKAASTSIVGVEPTSGDIIPQAVYGCFGWDCAN